MLSHVAIGVAFCSIALARAPAQLDTASSAQSGVRAGFSWEDYDSDGLPDAFAITADGAARLLRNQGDGSFADVTLISGLALSDVSFAAWFDFDRDGAPDLFVGTRSGPGRLVRNAHDGTFQDVTEFVGLHQAGRALEAQWLDYDLDGASDLALRTDAGEELYHALPNGRFEKVDLGVALRRAEIAGGASAVVQVDAASSELAGSSTSDERKSTAQRRRQAAGALTTGPGFNPAAPNWTLPGGPVLNIITCTDVIKNQATAACISASSTPTMGWLYPLSVNLNVSVGGDVGIGTATPAAKLDVAGTARIGNTLTLNPSGDQALDVSTGSIYKSGALFIHTKGAFGNTALGQQALSSVTSGSGNTASGYTALSSSTSGLNNTATGYRALNMNTTGSNNTATGHRALRANQTGTGNTAIGQRALEISTYGYANTATGTTALAANFSGSSNTATGNAALRFTTGTGNTGIGSSVLLFNTSGAYNTASGTLALYRNSSGSRNISIGFYAGSNLTTGDDNIAIGNVGVTGEGQTIRIGTSGTQTRTFIAGIRGVTTVNANAIPVVVDSAGQLGTVSSSRRFKQDIVDMGDATEKLLELRPVRFRYKQEQTMPDGSEVPLEYGLIAEEVAEILPDLVVYGDDGKPFTVKYHILSSMLLNEMKKEKAQHARELAELRNEFEARLAAVEARLSDAPIPAAASDGGR